MDSGRPLRGHHLGVTPLWSAPIAVLISLAAAVFATTPMALGATKGGHSNPPPVIAVGQPSPPSMNSATGVSCGDTDHCWVVGFGAARATASIAVSTDGGAKWTPQTVPSTVTALAAISCVGRRDCLAVGSTGSAGAGLSTVDGGADWRLTQVPSGVALMTAVVCTRKLSCVVLATDGMSYWSESTRDLGTTWSHGGPLPAGMTATGLSCSSSLVCAVAGYSQAGPGHGAGAIATTADGGATWALATVPTGSGLLRAASCFSLVCLAAGTASTATTGFVPGVGLLLASVDGGTTWQTATSSVGRDDAFAASCPDARTCIVVGTEWDGLTPPSPTGSIVASLDGGRQWRPARLRYVPVGLSAISCPAVNSCEAVGGDVFVHISLPVTPAALRHRGTPGTRAGTGAR